MLEKLEAIQKRFEELGVQLMDPAVHANIQEMQKAAKAHADLLPSQDKELAAMAVGELPVLKQKIAALESEIKLLLIPKDASDERDTIMEIRAGTGGEEAALFAGTLYRMYMRF